MLPEPMLFARGEKRDLNGKEIKGHEPCTHFGYVTECFAQGLRAGFVHSEDYFSLLVLVFPEGFWPLPRAARRICVLLHRVKRQSFSVNMCELFDFSLKMSSFHLFGYVLST